MNWQSFQIERKRCCLGKVDHCPNFLRGVGRRATSEPCQRRGKTKEKQPTASKKLVTDDVMKKEMNSKTANSTQSQFVGPAAVGISVLRW